MFWVMEYGEHIGTVKNLFKDLKKARNFAKRIMNRSARNYRVTGRYEWYCAATQEYIKIEKNQLPA